MSQREGTTRHCCTIWPIVQMTVDVESAPRERGGQMALIHGRSRQRFLYHLPAYSGDAFFQAAVEIR